MSVTADAPAQPAPMADLSTIANEIGTKGATGDAVLVELAKGVKDAVSKMTAMFGEILTLNKGKGKGTPAADDDDDDDDDDDAGGGAPGYQDMQLAVPGAGSGVTPAAVNNTGDFDVTQFCLNQAAQMRALAKGMQELKAENAELKELFVTNTAQLCKAVQLGAEAQLAIAGPLAKAVAEGREALLQIPGAPITPALRPRARPVDAALIGGNDRTEKQTLAKAQRVGVVDSEQLARFRATRRFAEDDGQHAAIRSQVDNLAKDFTAST